MTKLALFVLGTPRVELDGLEVKIPRRKAMALLVYLAMTGALPLDGLQRPGW